MSLTFSAGGDSATVTGYRIEYSQQRSRVRPDRGTSGRRFAQFLYHGQRDEAQQVRVTGLVKAASSVLLDAAMDSLVSVLGRGEVLVQDSDRDRFAVARTMMFQREFVPPHIYRVTLDLLLVDGVWFDDLSDTPNSFSATVTSVGSVRYVHVDFSGSATAPPRILCTLDSSGAGTNWAAPKIEWRGPNLFPNSSFEDGVYFPTGWTNSGNPARVVGHFGRTGSRCMQPYESGSTLYDFMIEVAVNQLMTYSVSAYVATSSLASAGNFYLTIQEKNAAGAPLGVPLVYGWLIQSPNWTRCSVSRTSYSLTASWEIKFQSVTANIALNVDDVQFEQTAAPTEFVDTSDPQWQHESFTHAVGLDTTDAAAGNPDKMVVDCALGRTRVTNGGIWVEANDAVNGAYFDVHPGLNHLFVSAPTSGSVVVEAVVPKAYF